MGFTKEKQKQKEKEKRNFRTFPMLARAELENEEVVCPETGSVDPRKRAGGSGLSPD